MRLRSLLLLSLLIASGCKRPDPGTARNVLDHGGLERTFVFHVPSNAPAAGSRMLVISLHGRGGSGVQQEDLTGLSALSDERGFIAVYPDGIEKSWADGRGTTPAEKQGVDDVGFISALIDHFINDHGADPKRVYISGHSNGGVMANRLGCELSEKIAAIAPVAAEIAELVSKTCSPKRAMSVMTFHGDADQFMPYLGGELEMGAGGRVLSAKEARLFWATKAGCAGEPVTTAMPDVVPDDGTTVTREESQGCAEGAEVVLFTVNGGGHTWPGSNDDLGELLVGKSNRDLIASEEQLVFFGRHLLP